eukprot:Skav221886  [mRNA]  locus=scaffold1395:505654:507060:+ [translate_table: standard]
MDLSTAVPLPGWKCWKPLIAAPAAGTPSGRARVPLCVAMTLPALALPWISKARRSHLRARQKLIEQVEQVQRYNRGELSEFETGVSTGYESFDSIARPVRGEVTVVSGKPGSGKSEFLLSLAMNLAEQHGWRTGLCNFEHKPDQLTLQLLEKKTKTNFKDLDDDALKKEASWIGEHFPRVADFSEELDLEQILRRAAREAEQGSLQGLIIDPYNNITSPRGLGIDFTETEMVSRYMTKLQQFAKKYKVCIWVVVHPTKGSQVANGPTSLYDLQGSAHWNNKCDKGLYIVRPNRDPSVGSTRAIELQVKKVRNGDSGRVGMCKLEFQPEIRSYSELAV